MRQHTYERVDKLYRQYHGYITTKELLGEGFTSRQISKLQQEGYLEKIANGCFWMMHAGLTKPHDYKPIEVGLVNKEAVVIADSACFYQGLIHIEPPRLSIATRRTDRHQMVFPFAVTRHYLAENVYDDGKHTVETPFGSYQVYEIGRSVCDCIRFRDSIEEDIFNLVIENYRKEDVDQKTKERLLAYSKMMKFEDRAKKIL